MAAIIPQQKKKSRKNIWRVVAVAAGVVFLAGCAFAFTEPGSRFYGWVGSSIGSLVNKQPVDNNDPEEAVPDNQFHADVVKDVQAGKSEDAIEAYETEIAATQESNEKADLYLRLSGSLLTYGTSDDDKQKALQYALKAEEIAPTQQSAAQLVQVYDSLGNTVESQKYQQLVADRDSGEWKDR